MILTLECIYYLLLTLVSNCSASVIKKDVADENLLIRIRRQDGYVYDRPSISFDLPSRSSTTSTQAPTVDRTLTQQMFYAYPAPTGGDTVNIGNTASTTTATAPTASATGATSGYNYGSSTTANAGYGYGAPSSTGAQANTASQITNTVSQTTVTGSQSATNTGTFQSGSGYSSNVPSPTLSPSLQGSAEVSTSAPRYLPPTGGQATGTASSSGGGSVNIGGGSNNSGTGQMTNTATQVGSTSSGIPSDNYLPPLVTNTDTRTQSVTTTDTQTNSGGSVSIPSTAYLPPKPSSTPAPIPSPAPTSSSQTANPSGGYIPPSGSGSNSGNVATSGYLPPGFFK